MLYFVSLYLAIALAKTSICASYSKPRNCSMNVAITTGILSYHQVANIKTCQKLCDGNPNCKGINYEEKTTKKCVLNSDSAGQDGQRLGYKAKFSYAEKLNSGAAKFATTTCQRFLGCRPILSFDNHVTVVSRRDTYGWWGRDTWSRATDDFWYEMTNYNSRRNLYEYATQYDFKSDLFTDIVLPFYCDGANYIVYKRFFYCGGYNTNRVYTYDLDRREQSTTISFANVEGKAAGYRDRCQYHWGGYSDIDMASDEFGLWVIWGRKDESCAFAISKIDPDSKTILKSWFPPRGIEFDKNDYGNAFMVCGNMYVMNHHHHRNTYVRWIYYTGNSSWVEIKSNDPNRIILENWNVYNSYLDYSPRDKKLYSWENTQHNTYLGRFKDWP